MTATATPALIPPTGVPTATAAVGTVPDGFDPVGAILDAAGVGLTADTDIARWVGRPVVLDVNPAIYPTSIADYFWEKRVATTGTGEPVVTGADEITEEIIERVVEVLNAHTGTDGERWYAYGLDTDGIDHSNDRGEVAGFEPGIVARVWFYRLDDETAEDSGLIIQ